MKENVYYSLFYTEIPGYGTVNLEVSQELSSFELGRLRIQPVVKVTLSL
jgi:hypothetical protein